MTTKIKLLQDINEAVHRGCVKGATFNKFRHIDRKGGLIYVTPQEGCDTEVLVLASEYELVGDDTKPVVEMRNNEINKAVAEKLGHKVHAIAAGEDHIWIEVPSTMEKDQVVLEMVNYLEWVYGGPIIKRYKINIAWREQFGNWNSNKGNTHGVPSDDPLKSAMICFLDLEIG